MVPIEGGTGGVTTMSLARSPRHSCHNPMGMPVYELSMDSDGGHDSFRAYWLPYRNGEAHCIKLGDAADLMFTSTMDGCTFAAGGDKHGPLVERAPASSPRHRTSGKIPHRSSNGLADQVGKRVPGRMLRRT